MIKIVSIAISAMVILLVSLFSDPDTKVFVTSSVAPRLVAGKDCIVKVSLTKPGASGYARLQQLLPQGLTATPIETKGAQFEMEDNLVKFIWTDLPEEDSFTVSYKVQTDPNEKDVEMVPGAFYYTADDRIAIVEMPLMKMDFTSGASAFIAKQQVERKIFAVTPESGKYKVELTIHVKKGEHTARFTDNIPDGYTVTNVNASSAKFMFSNRQATFIWNQLPADPVFKISYNLDAKGEHFTNPTVTGMLIYGAEGETQTSIASASADVTTASATAAAGAKTSDVIAANLLAQEQQKISAQRMTTYNKNSANGIFFKVQIAATRKSPVRNDSYFEKQYHFNQRVDLSEQDGWRKYMVGNFASYATANDFNQRMRKKIPDSFVVAYRNAERVQIKEAMAVASKSN